MDRHLKIQELVELAVITDESGVVAIPPAMEAHLQSCETCRREVDAWQNVRQVFWARIEVEFEKTRPQAAIRGGDPLHRPELSGSGNRKIRLRHLVELAACILVGLSVVLFLLSGKSPGNQAGQITVLPNGHPADDDPDISRYEEVRLPRGDVGDDSIQSTEETFKRMVVGLPKLTFMSGPDENLQLQGRVQVLRFLIHALPDEDNQESRLSQLGQLLWKSGELKEEIVVTSLRADFIKKHRGGDQAAAALLNHANRRLNSGNYPNAALYFNLNIEKYPDSIYFGEAHLGLGRSLESTGQIALAAEYYEIAADKMDSNRRKVLALRHLHSVLFQMQRFEKALKIAKLSAELSDELYDKAYNVYIQGVVAMSRKQDVKALSQFRQVINRFPSNPTPISVRYLITKSKERIARIQVKLFESVDFPMP